MDGPSVDSARPIAIITAPPATVQRTPIRSAMRPIRMPPRPDPIHISALAKAGIERWPPASAAISLRATMVIHGAPKAIAMMARMTPATSHEVRVSTDGIAACSMEPAV